MCQSKGGNLRCFDFFKIGSRLFRKKRKRLLRDRKWSFGDLHVIKSVVNFVKFVPIIMVRDKLSGLKVKDNRKQYMGCSIW